MPNDNNNLSKDGERAIKTVAKGGGIVFIGLIFSRVFEYLYRMVIARYLGPSQYGLISLGMAVLGFATPVALFGLHQGMKRHISYYKGEKNYEKVKSTLLSGSRVLVPLSITVGIIVFFLSDFLAVEVFQEPSAVIILKIFAVIIPLQAISRGCIKSIEAFKEMKYSVLSKEIFGKASKIVLTVILVLLGFGALGAAWAYAFSFLVALVLSSYFLYKKILPDYDVKEKVELNYKEIISFSWPLFFGGILFSIRAWTDVFMIGYFKNSTLVGLYNAALPTAILLVTFSKAINRIIFPVMSELYSQNKLGELEKIYKAATKWTFSFTFPLFLLMVFFAPKVLEILFGQEYAAASLPLSILAFSYFLATFVGSTGQILKVIDKTKIILINSIFSTAINVVLNYFLIQKFGLVGTAIATGISIIFINIMMLAENYHFLGIHPYKLSYIKPAISGIISISLIYLLINIFFDPTKLILIIGVFSFLIFYGILFLLFGSIEQEDLLILRSIEEKTKIKIKWLRKLIKYFI